jgi:hypothetical protein
MGAPSVFFSGKGAFFSNNLWSFYPRYFCAYYSRVSARYEFEGEKEIIF